MDAHHIIPTELLTKNKVVQDAVEAGFDFNGIANGIGVDKLVKGVGEHANHPKYTDQIGEVLNKWKTDMGKKYTPEKAREFLKGYANKLKQQIQKECIEGGKKVNDLIIK
jgi:hemerythrin-like domain-containing protein